MKSIKEKFIEWRQKRKADKEAWREINSYHGRKLNPHVWGVTYFEDILVGTGKFIDGKEIMQKKTVMRRKCTCDGCRSEQQWDSFFGWM